MKEGYCVCVRENDRQIDRQIDIERERVYDVASVVLADGMADRHKL